MTFMLAGLRSRSTMLQLCTPVMCSAFLAGCVCLMSPASTFGNAGTLHAPLDHRVQANPFLNLILACIIREPATLWCVVCHACCHTLFECSYLGRWGRLWRWCR